MVSQILDIFRIFMANVLVVNTLSLTFKSFSKMIDGVYELQYNCIKTIVGNNWNKGNSYIFILTVSKVRENIFILLIKRIYNHSKAYAVGKKIIRALEIIRVKKKSYLMKFCDISICEVMIFWLFTVYNKHEMIKFGKQKRENSQVLSQVLE